MFSQTSSTSQPVVNDPSLRTSLIIATKDRPGTLQDTLATVLEQTILPAEVIVVDQSKTSETRDVVARLAEVAKQSGHVEPQFVYLCDPSLNGAGAARNLGIESAHCPILLFLDDDVLLENSFLAEILAVYSQHSDVGMVSGIISNYQKPSFREGFFERFFCIGAFRDERLPLYWNADALRYSEPIPIRKVSGCVMSVSRSALGSERFNSNYRGRGEDVDVSWRVSERFPTLLTPRARLTHLCTNVGRVREHWITSVVTSQYYLYYRHWNAGITNRICFFWFHCGVLIVAAVASVRQGSLVPLWALIDGIRQAHSCRSAGPAPRHDAGAAADVSRGGGPFHSGEESTAPKLPNRNY
jgi:GT2 family glycosyltransferase